MKDKEKGIAYYHLPGLFEFYELYRMLLPIFRAHREYFYEWCEIGSIYGAPAGCVWGGGRVELGDVEVSQVFDLLKEYEISPRLTFSNSLLQEEHLSDRQCNSLCRELCRFSEEADCLQGGVIVHSPLLQAYLEQQYPALYLVSSTTKVLTDFRECAAELEKEVFRYVVPDFRLNPQLEHWKLLPEQYRKKVEFLCNECCFFGCTDRKRCYEAVSRKNLGIDGPEHVCRAPYAGQGYRFSRAMKNPGFIGLREIKETYLPMGYTNFKIEGRGLGSAMILEFLLYYMTKPEYQLQVREEIYLDSMLDLF